MDIKLLMLSRGWLQYLSTYHYRGASVDYRAAMRRAVAPACGVRLAHPDPLRDRPHAVSARETPGSAWGRCACLLFLLLEA